MKIALAAHRDDALLYRELTRLRTDVPLAESLTDLAFAGVPRERFAAWCDTVGAATLRARILG